MFNVRLLDDYLYRQRLFTWLSLVMSLMGVLFCAVCFPHKMFWIRFGTESSQFLRTFLPTLSHTDLVVHLANFK